MSPHSESPNAEFDKSSRLISVGKASKRATNSYRMWKERINRRLCCGKLIRTSIRLSGHGMPPTTKSEHVLLRQLADCSMEGREKCGSEEVDVSDKLTS